jgi:hypothetical protein
VAAGPRLQPPPINAEHIQVLEGLTVPSISGCRRNGGEVGDFQQTLWIQKPEERNLTKWNWFAGVAGGADHGTLFGD